MSIIFTNIHVMDRTWIGFIICELDACPPIWRTSTDSLPGPWHGDRSHDRVLSFSLGPGPNSDRLGLATASLSIPRLNPDETPCMVFEHALRKRSR